MDSNISRLIKETLIREELFHVMKSEVTFTFDLHHDSGGHTKVRQSRHGDDTITDEDIIELLEDAKADIMYNIIDGYISDKVRFIVSRDGDDYLNVVVLPVQLNETTWNLVTITVMRNDNFKTGGRQLQIFV